MRTKIKYIVLGIVFVSLIANKIIEFPLISLKVIIGFIGTILIFSTIDLIKTKIRNKK